jgi:hypothetical protein
VSMCQIASVSFGGRFDLGDVRAAVAAEPALGALV